MSKDIEMKHKNAKLTILVPAHGVKNAKYHGWTVVKPPAGKTKKPEDKDNGKS